MKNILNFSLLVLSFLLSACMERRMANFDSRYNEFINIDKSNLIFEKTIQFDTCDVIPANDHVSAAKEMAENGYILVGDVIFPGKPLNQLLFKTHCGRKGAEKALLSIDLVNSKTFNIPYSHKNVSYANTTINGQYGNYLGNISTTNTSYETRFVPYTINSYKNWSSYWIKGKTPIFGAYYDELPESAKYESEFNYGAYVYLIVKNSPAYFANIIVGDVITAIDGNTVYTPQDLTKILTTKAGKEVTINLKRKGESRTIILKLGTLFS